MAKIIEKMMRWYKDYQQKRVENYNDAVRERAADCINIREFYEPAAGADQVATRMRCIVVYGEVAYIEKQGDKRDLLDLLQEARQAYFLKNCKHPKRKLS